MKNAILNRFCIAKMAIIVLGMLASDAYAQIPSSMKSDTISPLQKEKRRKPAVAPQTEFSPEYKDGVAAMYKFLNANIRFKKSDLIANNHFTGGNHAVYVGFIVTEKGEIKDVFVKKGVKDLPELDKEAVRVVKLMSGKWVAGKHQNKAVDMPYTIPVSFHFD
jgi:Gram-negative bacterial TonB protein C-terminal